MTTFDELVGGEPTGDERARLRNVHELLVEAGPPPEIPPEIASGPTLVMTLGRVRRPALGVRTIPISPELADEIGLPVDHGLLIVQVTPGGSADLAGLRGGTERAYLGNIPIMLGGDLIVAIDDQQVGDEQDLSQVMNNHRAGDTVKITIYRNKKKMDVNVSLGEARQQV